MSDGMVLFGGSFDPVHNGHLIVARAVAEQFGFARVVLVPARQSPHKSGVFAPAADRLEMLRLAVEGEGLFEVSDIEIARAGPSYTIDTLDEFRRLHPQTRLAWVIGADMLADLPKWHCARDLVERFELVIAARPPDNANLPALFERLEEFFGPHNTRRLRKAVAQNPLIDISSTEIRKRIIEGKTIAHLVPQAVGNYIGKNDLYR